MTLTPDHKATQIKLNASISKEHASVVTDGALEFLGSLHRQFETRRKELMVARAERQKQIDSGELPRFLAETESIRKGDWRTKEPPPDLQDRRVEITGPVSRKMVINALNSGAKVFMADFEDANCPTFRNNLDGQVNLYDAVRRQLSLTTPAGKMYAVGSDPATLVVRPRGWHLQEKHLLVDGQPISAALFDFGLYFYHNARELLANGSGPYFYLPKIENHHEARLWNDVFAFSESYLRVERASISATVLIETILAAFEMDEILYELKDYITALNAGRWDYIFSVIKKFKTQAGAILPDRAQVTMGVPFMRAYTELLVKTCHRRGAHAMGGMAAFIPSRNDQAVNKVAFEKVREDKQREAAAGFDGTWVAHPDLVPVAREIFDAVLGENPHQKRRLREDVDVRESHLLDFQIPGGQITEAGIRGNISVGLRYIDSWLSGLGAVAIDNLMEDTATAEIARAQVWQWIHAGNISDEKGKKVTIDTVLGWVEEERDRIIENDSSRTIKREQLEDARQIFTQLVISEHFMEFLTWPAYEHIY